MKTVKGLLKASRFFCLAAFALFLFFLVYSAPHRVHHSFEHTQSPPCPVFSFATGCYLEPASAINLLTSQIATEKIVLFPEVWIPYRTPSPFSQRAPPVV